MLATTIAAFAAPPAGAEKPSFTRLVFELRVGADLNNEAVYTAYRLEPRVPASIVVRRGHGLGGDRDVVTISGSACSGLQDAVAAFGRLPLPSLTLGELPPYDWRRPRPVQYQIRAFTSYANGAAGQVSFSFAEVPGRPADRQLAWARRLMEIVDRCAGP